MQFSKENGKKTTLRYKHLTDSTLNGPKRIINVFKASILLLDVYFLTISNIKAMSISQ